jgi:hypothetical protein
MSPTPLIAGLAAAIALSSSAAAQEPEGGAEARFAVGVVSQRGVFGDDDPKAASTLGGSLSAQVRRRTTGRTGFSFETVWQPVGIPNPHFDETLNTVYFLIGPEIGRRTYVRPVGGVALQAWSGSQTESGLNFALAAGVAVGHRVAARRVWLNPEIVVRCSASPGAASTMLGVQMAVGARK